MKTVTKEFVLLEKGEIEEAVTKYLGKKENVTIGQMECVLTYTVDISTYQPDGMMLDIKVGEKWIDAFDLFWDDDTDTYLCKGKEISLNEEFLSPEYIFAFDVKLFKCFTTETDTSD